MHEAYTERCTQLAKPYAMKKILLYLQIFVMCSVGLRAQTPEHKWVNEIKQTDHSDLIHKTYYSEIHQTEIGYSIALPQGYEEKKNSDRGILDAINSALKPPAEITDLERIFRVPSLESFFESVSSAVIVLGNFGKLGML